MMMIDPTDEDDDDDDVKSKAKAAGDASSAHAAGAQTAQSKADGSGDASAVANPEVIDLDDSGDKEELQVRGGIVRCIKLLTFMLSIDVS